MAKPTSAKPKDPKARPPVRARDTAVRVNAAVVPALEALMLKLVARDQRMYTRAEAIEAAIAIATQQLSST